MSDTGLQAALIQVDLHSHTSFSQDGWTGPNDLVDRARDAGIDRIAVTDHGEIDGALLARERDPARVIVGEEVRCRGGTEVIGLFLAQRIPDGLPLEEVVERIRDQDGVVYAPHPFAYLTRAAPRAARLLAVADVVEIFNSRAFLPRWNRSAGAAAAAWPLPGFASSDAHFPWEIGRAFTRMPAFADAGEFLQMAAHALPVGVRTANPAIHVASVALRMARAVRGRISRSHPLPQVEEGG